MSRYAFTFKKDDIFVEFITTDKEIVEKQFQVWVADADDYARGHNQGKGKRENEKEEAKPQNLQPSNPQEVSSQLTTHSSPKIEATAEEFIPVKEQSPPEVLDKASTLLKTINTIQGTDKANSEEQIANSNVSLQGMSESNDEAIQKEDFSTQEAPTSNFEAVLEQSIENPTFEPAKTQDKVFLNLVHSKNTTDKFHYLIITAYYLSEFEKLQRFSLKQINAKLMQNLSEAIDHSTLQSAINQNFVELVPDLTGVSDVAEYKLTLVGEEFFANKI